MKRLLLITCIFVTVVLAGVLHGNYKQQENSEELVIKDGYASQYPETTPMVTPILMTTVPF
jgi:hypothetical protein